MKRWIKCTEKQGICVEELDSSDYCVMFSQNVVITFILLFDFSFVKSELGDTFLTIYKTAQVDSWLIALLIFERECDEK